MNVESLGDMLRYWRKTRRMSQLDLALTAGSSARHLSFVETGRSTPSRELLMCLAQALDMPLRERNVLLQSAGYAAVYRESRFDGPEMSQVRHALDLLLRQHEPFGAVVLDRRWNILMANAAYTRFMRLLVGPDWHPGGNALRNLFSPDGVRRFIGNWDEVAAALLPRVQREAAWDRDPELGALIAELLAYPGVSEIARRTDLAQAQKLLIPLEINAGPMAARLFTTIATLGTPLDITLQELRVESFHPADEATEALARALASGSPRASAD